MPSGKLHDFSKDNIDVWYSRIVKVARVGEFWLDVGRSVLTVLAGVLFGAVAGVLLGGMAPNFFWAAVVVGAVLGGLAGGTIAKRVFFGDRAALAATEGADFAEALFAPHMPGVQEQFARARKREFALFLALVPCGMFLAYLYKAEPGWPVPGFLPRDQLLWGVLTLFVVMFALLVWNARCPGCGRRIGGLMRLRRCPICGVAFRD